jgi:hypothetical protein
MASTIKADTLQSTTSNIFVLNSAGTEYARFHTTDGITFSNGGAERVRITNDGNVGIGTTGPSNFGGTNLQVANTNIASVVWTNGTYTGQLLASASAEVTVGSRSNHVLRFSTNDTERARIDTSGNFKLSSAGTKVLNSSGNPILQQTGSILQVVSTTKTDTFSMAGYTGYTDITGLTVTITPTSSTSKILIDYVVSTGPSDVVSLQLFRNSTAICIGDSASGARFQATAGGVAVVNGDKVFPVAGNFLDSPATTSAITYKFQMRNWAGTSYVNRTPNDADAGYTSRSTSTITVMEIAG